MEMFSVLALYCGPQYAYLALSTVFLYSLFTLGVTQWRTQFRVNMNKVSLGTKLLKSDHNPCRLIMTQETEQ